MKTIQLAAAFITLSATTAFADCLAVRDYDRRQPALPSSGRTLAIAPAFAVGTSAKCAGCAPGGAICSGGGRMTSWRSTAPAAERGLSHLPRGRCASAPHCHRPTGPG